MDIKEELIDFNEKLKNHLSNEFLYLSEKKSEYENQIVQLTIDKEQKYKTLFQHIDNTGARKYFSPLNLNELESETKDEKQKQISSHIDQIQKNIASIDERLTEINQLESDLEDIILKL